MNTLQREVESFTDQARARHNFSTKPALQKIPEQIEHYGPQVVAVPLVASTPRGIRTIEPQRTNNRVHASGKDQLVSGLRAAVIGNLPEPTRFRSFNDQAAT
jgi:hypothetical protein